MRAALIAILLTCATTHVRAAVNAAKGQPYLLWSPPVSGSDVHGREKFGGCRAWYRGQLTDGFVGEPDHRRANDWVRFPQSCGPVCVIDLGGSRRVLGVAVHALGGGPRNLAFPTAVRVEAFGSFPPSNERKCLGWSTFGFPHTKGEGKLSIKELRVQTDPREARFMRIEVNGRRNAGLWITEIEVLADEHGTTPLASPPTLPENVALRANYSTSAEPYEKYPDRTGKELTDGVFAGAFEKHSAWAAWPRRAEVDVELPQEERVSSAELGALGGRKWGIDFPKRVELYALDAKAQGQVWLRLGMVQGGGAPKELEGRFAMRRYFMSFAPIQASQYRLVATGGMIFLDEIVLGAARAQTADAPVGGVSRPRPLHRSQKSGSGTPRSAHSPRRVGEPVLREAATPSSHGPRGAMCEVEDCTGARVVADGAAVGAKASRLESGHKLTFRAELAPGDYVVRVRARPTKPDVFNAVVLRVNGHELQPLCVTMPPFTRQRRYFRLTEPGARVELSLREGSPVIVDRFRIEPAFEAARIRELKPLCMDTTLVEHGEPKARIVVPSAGQFAAHASRLAATVERLSGATLPIVRDVEVQSEAYAKHAHVVLGTYMNNRQVWPLAPNSWGRPPLPKPGEFALITYHNPMGLGRNAVALLANEDEGMDQALAALEAKLTPGSTLRLPHLYVPSPAKLTDERKRETIVEAGKWTRQHLRSFLTRWKRYGPEGFRLLAYRFFECLDSKDAVRVDLYHAGFADAELQKLICCWDRWEEDPCFSDLERLAITNVLYDVARFCQFPYGRYLWGLKGNREPEVLLDFARKQKPRLRWNHQTFPAYSLLTAGQYFGKYYSLPEAPIWLELAKIGFEPMRHAAKPGEDCWGYQDITMIHTLRYFTAIGDEDYLNSGSEVP